MSSIDASLKTNLQGKLFDLALLELVKNYRESFEPLWSTDSWVKFLILLALKSGLSGEQESLELFAEAIGHRVTSKMRRVFFERRLEEQGLLLMADPSEAQVLIMPTAAETEITEQLASDALRLVGLADRTVADPTLWESHDSLLAIPWKFPYKKS